MSWQDVVVEIDDKGQLWMKRGTGVTQMLCPYAGGNKGCGDWCPLFHEPDITVSGAFLELCETAYRERIENITDKRTDNRSKT